MTLARGCLGTFWKRCHARACRQRLRHHERLEKQEAKQNQEAMSLRKNRMQPASETSPRMTGLYKFPIFVHKLCNLRIRSTQLQAAGPPHTSETSRTREALGLAQRLQRVWCHVGHEADMENSGDRMSGGGDKETYRPPALSRRRLPERTEGFEMVSMPPQSITPRGAELPPMSMRILRTKPWS